jgi:hypothetical protein
MLNSSFCSANLPPPTDDSRSLVPAIGRRSFGILRWGFMALLASMAAVLGHLGFETHSA